MKSNPQWVVLGFLKFFGTPLCIAAFLAAIVAITRARNGRWEEAVLAALIALACGGAGFGTIWWVRFHTRAPDPIERLRAANPSAPWMWREDWAAGEVRTTLHEDSRRLLTIGSLWCVATFPIFYIVVHAALARRDYSATLALIFPLAGVVMLGWAMRLRRRYHSYGESTFVMDSVPGRIGGSLSGKIQVDKPLAAGQSVALDLACVNRTTRGMSHNLTNWDWILWRDEQTSMCDSSGSIRVAFLIAPDCHPTDDSNPKSRIVWRLDARAPGAAGGYRAEFEVPVFRIQDFPLKTAI